MERFTISKSEKQSIYEIYRACRLCGAGGGYRMPIIQNIVDLDGSKIELRQKIQDCLQLEVSQDDRMPPLICELCVDKVNEFYKFFEMSRQTNIRTRTRLGLPLQTAKKGEPDCILGVTEPVYVDDPPKKSRAGPKCSKKIKKEEDIVNIKEEKVPPPTPPSPEQSRSSSVASASSRSSRGRRAPTPPRPTRSHPAKPTRTETPKHNQVAPEKKSGKENEPKPRLSRKELSDLMQDAHLDESSLLVPRSMKRGREAELPKPLILPKRARMAPKEQPKVPVKEPVKVPEKVPAKEPTPPPRPRAKPGPKSKQAPKTEPANIPVPLKILKTKPKVPMAPPKEEVPRPKTFVCTVCNLPFKSVHGVSKHRSFHVPTYTKPQNACNPCGKWFVTIEEAAVHHRYHRSATFPYHCRRCFDDFRSLQLYNEHIERGQCAVSDEVPDVSCDQCWRTFATLPLRDAHKCPGADGRPGGKCSKCNKWYATHRNLKKHESTCNQRRKRDLIADPDVLRRLKPMQVRIARCDDLLSRMRGEHYDVSRVRPNHGLDKLYHYPYIRFETVKSEPLRANRTTAVNEPITEECERDSFIHWDSEDSDSDDVVKKVDSLAILSIKKLFSKNMLGKVPRKRKRAKNESFDLGNDFGNMSSDINDIISSLSDESGTDCVVRNMNEQLRISLNHIIGVPDDNVPSVRDVGNENVASNENVNINDSTEKDTEIVFNDKCGDTNENVELTNEHLNDANENGEMNDNNVSCNDEKLNARDVQDDQNTIIEEANVESCNDNNLNTEDAQDDQNTIIEDANVESFNDNSLNTEDPQDDQNTITDEANVESCNDNNLNTQDPQDGLNTITGEANDESCNDKNLNTQDAKDGQNSIIEDANVESFNDNSLNTQDPQDDQNTITDEANIENCNDNNLNTQDPQDGLNTISDEANVENCNDNNLNTQDAQDDQNTIIEKAKVEVIEKICNDAITEVETNSSNKLDIETESNGENVELNRIENEKDDSSQNSEEITLHNSIENHREVTAVTVEHENPTVNGNNDHENETDSKHEESPEVNNSESKKSEEINKLVQKESPIKHSIENLIGDTDRNPDKYINEVISSIEDIIMKNPRTEDGQKSNEREKAVIDYNDIDDQNLMDALDAQIGDTKESIDNDKITLEDLLPKEDRSMDLDDISDDDFNFDA